AGAPTGRGWDWFCCRSTAPVRTGQPQSTSHSSPPSHPRRVLLRSGVGFGFVVGAPPRCERGRHAFAPGRVLLRVGVGIGFVVGSPPSVRKGWARVRTRGGCSYGSGVGLALLSAHRPRCERGGHAFAPGAGAPTGRSWVWFCCRSTALGAKGVGTHSHPGRVLLRVGVGFGSVVGAPPSVRMGWARIRTRGGCSYGSWMALVLV